MSTKVKEYYVSVNRTVLGLYEDVNSKIKEGFQPVGGVAIGKLSLKDSETGNLSENIPNLYQAMVRYED